MAADEKRVSGGGGGGGGGMEREAVKKCKPTQIFSRKTATTDAGSAAPRPICMQRERPRPRRRSRSRRPRARYIQWRCAGGGTWRRVESLLCCRFSLSSRDAADA